MTINWKTLGSKGFFGEKSGNWRAKSPLISASLKLGWKSLDLTIFQTFSLWPFSQLSLKNHLCDHARKSPNTQNPNEVYDMRCPQRDKRKLHSNESWNAVLFLFTWLVNLKSFFCYFREEVLINYINGIFKQVKTLFLSDLTSITLFLLCLNVVFFWNRGAHHNLFFVICFFMSVMK